MVTYRSLTNPSAWQAYAGLAKPAITDAGGRFIALGKPAMIYEAGMDQIVVLVEFDGLQQAIACHETPAYRDALGALGIGNVERDIRIVEGTA